MSPSRAPSDHDPPRHPRNAFLAVLGAAVLTLIAPLALIASGHNAGRAASDSIVYHERFIRSLAEDWPRFDLSDPLTATTPGYHIALATLDTIGLGSITILRLGSAAIGVALAIVLASWIARRARPLDAVLLAAPLGASIYVIGPSAWLLPDNLAWLGVLLVLIACVREPRSWRPIALASAALAGLVFTRQIHLWAAAPVWIAAWMGVARTEPMLFDRVPARLTRGGVALLLTLPAFAIVAWFVHLWQGPTPPRFQQDIGGVNPATPAFILLQVPILMIGFGPWLFPAFIRALRDHPRTILLSAGIGLALALLPITTENPDAGRYSGWWMLAGKAPVLFGRTGVVFVVLAPLGAMLLCGALLGVTRRTGWVLLGSLVAFAVAQSATINSWQRYHEPFLIILLAMLAASQPADLRATPFARLRIPGMLALCAILAAISFDGFRGDPVAPGTTPPPIHSQPTDPWFQPEAP